MSTRLLENMVQFTIPVDFADSLFPERSPAVRNGRGGKYELEYASGMELCMTFIRTMERGWKIRDSKQRGSITARSVTASHVCQRLKQTIRDLLHRIGMKYDQYLDVSAAALLIKPSPNLNQFRQQDAHELLRHLLDGMYMEEFDIIKKRQPPPPKGKKKQSATLNQEERLIPFVDQVFGGQFASMLICSSCKHASTSHRLSLCILISGLGLSHL